MIEVHSPSIDLDFNASGNFPNQLSTSKCYVSHKHGIPVLGCPHKMIFAIPDRVTALFIFCHTSVLNDPSPKGEGFTDPLSGTLKFKKFFETQGLTSPRYSENPDRDDSECSSKRLIPILRGLNCETHSAPFKNENLFRVFEVVEEKPRNNSWHVIPLTQYSCVIVSDPTI